MYFWRLYYTQNWQQMGWEGVIIEKFIREIEGSSESGGERNLEEDGNDLDQSSCSSGLAMPYIMNSLKTPIRIVHQRKEKTWESLRTYRGSLPYMWVTEKKNYINWRLQLLLNTNNPIKLPGEWRCWRVITAPSLVSPLLNRSLEELNGTVCVGAS